MNDYSMYIGLDLSDRTANYCILNAAGEIDGEGSVRLNQSSLRRFFGGMERSAVAFEAGTHSRWVQDVLLELNHVPVVANPRKLRAIYTNEYKSDQRDAEMLARLLRSDSRLLSPIVHRGREAHADLAVIKCRDHLVRDRVRAINLVRGTVKSHGHRLPACSAESFHHRAAADIPACLQPALSPVIEHIASLTERIHTFDATIATLAKERYPETARLTTVIGVGALTALAFVLTIEEPHRFAKSREVGPFLGLVPRRDQSGNRDPHLSITKCGDAYVRRLLIGSSHYILGHFGKPCALRDWGLEHAQGQGRGAKRVAVTAVARKLAILLHRLWVDDVDFEPYPTHQRRCRTSHNKRAA